ncbi:hypothetical protein PsYK624_068540 [Phanerochaete sordida]|uniref:Uncharacterized protein n=1 Tax=Phanerochaete sordida TaxID=48140 RepID=A0A9P3GA06_9APHY|nr:hypothetical protein PsYK624_068540 [Phanerochaete sordida]
MKLNAPVPRTSDRNARKQPPDPLVRTTGVEALPDATRPSLQTPCLMGVRNCRLVPDPMAVSG